MATQFQPVRQAQGAQLALALDRAEELDAQVTRILGRADLDEPTAELLRLLAGHKGAASAITAAEIARQLDIGFRPGEHARRWVTEHVEDLRTRFKIEIGAAKTKPRGYFLVLDAADNELMQRRLRNEWFAAMRNYYLFAGKHATARAHGQMMLELDREDGGKAA